MVRLVSLVAPFIVVTLTVFRCPEDSAFSLARGVRIAGHLAAVVDAGSLAEFATTGEGAEVGHHPVFKQKRVESPARGVRSADHLAAVVDAVSLAVVATEEGA